MSKKSEAKKARKSAERKRTAAAKIVSTGKIGGKKAKPAQIEAARVRKMKAASDMRAQGTILRGISGREKGQRTTYTGPAKRATLAKIKAATGEDLPTTGTKWQKVNKAWLNDIMAEDPKLSRAQARSKLKTIFANNRERFLTEQQRRYDANIVAPVLDDDEDLGLDDKGRDDKGRDDKGRDDKGRDRFAKMTGGSEYLATKYDRPGLLDWSDLAPPEMPGTLGTAPAQAGLLERGLAAYQPWRRPGVGEAFKYQPPAGPTYATRASILGGASPSVSGAGDDITADNGNGKTYGPGGTYDNYQDWYMAPENPAGHYWALANTARAKGDVSPWGNQMVNGIWQYTGGSAPTGPTGPTGSTAARQDITQNQFQDLFADVGQVGGDVARGRGMLEIPYGGAGYAWNDPNYSAANQQAQVSTVAAPTVASAPRFTNYADPLLLQQTNPFMTNQGTQNAYLAGVTGVDPQFSGSFPGMGVGLLGPR